MQTELILKRTPLYQEHIGLKAKMMPFGGWDMPVQYKGILYEYAHTRNSVSIFDICHMGEFIIEGDYLESGLDKIVTMKLDDLPVRSCRYGAMLNDEGGVIDDLIVFRIEKDKWMLVVNASKIEKDSQHIQEHLTEKSSFKDISSVTGKIDIQGPLSRDILCNFVEDIKKLDYYTFDFFDLFGENVLISRTGYTGELGYEIYFPWDKIELLWRGLLDDEKVEPAGLGARDVLRLEMGYSLYGHELKEDMSVLKSGLGKFIDLDKEFIGKEAVLKQKIQDLPNKIVGFISENRRSPRSEQKIFNASHEEIGVVTSGTFSPYLKRGIGLGLVLSRYSDKNSRIFFGDEKNKNSAVIEGRIFYKKGSLKN